MRRRCPARSPDAGRRCRRPPVGQVLGRGRGGRRDDRAASAVAASTSSSTLDDGPRAGHPPRHDRRAPLACRGARPRSLRPGLVDLDDGSVLELRDVRRFGRLAVVPRGVVTRTADPRCPGARAVRRRRLTPAGSGRASASAPPGEDPAAATAGRRGRRQHLRRRGAVAGRRRTPRLARSPGPGGPPARRDPRGPRRRASTNGGTTLRDYRTVDGEPGQQPAPPRLLRAVPGPLPALRRRPCDARCSTAGAPPGARSASAADRADDDAPYRAVSRTRWYVAAHVRPVLPLRQDRARHRRQPRHRPDDRPRLRRGRRARSTSRPARPTCATRSPPSCPSSASAIACRPTSRPKPACRRARRRSRRARGRARTSS